MPQKVTMPPQSRRDTQAKACAAGNGDSETATQSDWSRAVGGWTSSFSPTPPP